MCDLTERERIGEVERERGRGGREVAREDYKKKQLKKLSGAEGWVTTFGKKKSELTSSVRAEDRLQG